MPYLIDEVARILASPMPRRQALRLLSGVLASSIFGTLGGKRAEAQNAPFTCNPACKKNEICCGPPRACAPQGWVCCGNTACPKGQCKNGRCNASPA